MDRAAKIVGLDITKSVFAAAGIDANGKPVFKRMLGRNQVREAFANMPPSRWRSKPAPAPITGRAN